jgi:N-acetylglucosamine-6-phosphate deacetylase
MSVVIAISGATVLSGEGPVENGVLVVDGERIAAVGRRSAIDIPDGARLVDGTGLLLAPGLIELQLNGGFGHDFTEQPASIWAVGARLPEHGVTAFLPTVISSPPATVVAARAVLAAGPAPGYRGAVVLGLHLEGPFLSPHAAGAHDPHLLRAPDPALVADWTPGGGVLMATVAPELDGALELIEMLADAGVIVSAGHSAASYEQGAAAIEAGVRYATHLLNAMPQLDKRAPGLAGALLDDGRVTIGVIADGIHLHPAVLRLVDRACGRARLSAVTDATAALGMPAGTYTLAGGPVVLDGTSVRRPDGRLAGSALTADEALRRLAALTGRGPADALAAMTEVPARLLGISSERGTLAAGARADLLLITPRLEVVATFIGGEEVHSAWR